MSKYPDKGDKRRSPYKQRKQELEETCPVCKQEICECDEFTDFDVPDELDEYFKDSPPEP